MSSDELIWERLAATEPHFAVLTHLDHLRDRLTPEILDRFLATGREHVERLFLTIHSCIRPDFRPDRAIDFGCGVGRVTAPLAAASGEIVAADVAPSMLEIARETCRRSDAGNVRFRLDGDGRVFTKESFDLVHCFLVFQHIRPAHGYRLFERMLDSIRPGGVCVAHFVHGFAHRKAALAALAARWIPFASRYMNRRLGLRSSLPPIRMYAYDLAQIEALATGRGLRIAAAEPIPHGVHLGTLFYFAREEAR